jgi:isopentenyldiphosphate isomerase
LTLRSKGQSIAPPLSGGREGALEELFETYDEAGRPMGLMARRRVHALGVWHRSAHVFLFDSAGALFVQRRAPGKDLYPDLWDYSVGEHLVPGETYLAAAHRGLAEELGVRGVSLEPVGEVRRWRSHQVDLAIEDNELQQAFTGVHDGPFEPDAAEVAEVRAVDIEQLAAQIERWPHRFTPWFVRDLKELGFVK